ncbi:CAP domain-containing protein [Streptomyces sp. NPDC059766]|uniref:CAP domain-containing protein n=1 Tax=Streptomyces sp. NPDC059766 TaxID=3346940 RepID=UPI0036681EE7
MGRHGRSATGHAAEVMEAHDPSIAGWGDRGPQDSYGDAPTAMGTAPYLNPTAYPETAYPEVTAHSDAPLYAPQQDGGAWSDATMTFLPGTADGYGHEYGYGYGPRYESQYGYGNTYGSAYENTYGNAHESTYSHPVPDQRVAHDSRPVHETRPVRTDRPAREDHPAADDRPVRDPRFPRDAAFTRSFLSEGFTPDEGVRRSAHRRRKKRAGTPVRSGLLGVSAAVALGTVAVATGVVPGLENYRLGGGTSGSDNVQAADSPSNSATEQGGTSGTAAERDDSTAAGRGSQRASASAAATPAAPAAPKPSATPSTTPSKAPTADPGTAETTPSQEPTTATKPPKQSSSAVTVSAEAQAEAEVLKLVNEERAKVGCSALTASGSLTQLAEAFSEDMAQRNFFDHTDPDGATPWDRAAKAGISSLGGENIARGQTDAEAVMEAWMNSPGHRANILNCDFNTLGVGVHFGEGGPWWTQDFGY